MPPPEYPRRRRRSRNSGPSPETVAQWTPEEQDAHKRAQCLQTPIAEMQLSVRCVNTLEALSVILCKDLMEKTVEELMEIPNFGETTLREIIRAVTTLGLTPPWKMLQQSSGKKKKKKGKKR